MAERSLPKPRPPLRASRIWQDLSDAADAAEADGHLGDYRRYTVLHRLALMQLAASYIIDTGTRAIPPSATAPRDAYELLVNLAVDLPDLAMTLLASDVFGDATGDAA